METNDEIKAKYKIALEELKKNCKAFTIVLKDNGFAEKLKESCSKISKQALN